MATKKTAPKKKAATKKATPVAAASPSPPGLRKTKRATLRLSDEDFNRLRWEILSKEKFSWQDLLSVSVNGWLEKHGYAQLEDVE